MHSLTGSNTKIEYQFVFFIENKCSSNLFWMIGEIEKYDQYNLSNSLAFHKFLWIFV